jgi:hypothetical protein
MEIRGVSTCRDGDHSCETHEQAEDLTPRKGSSEKRNRKKGEKNRPGVVERLGLLSGEAAVGAEEEQVVHQRVEEPEAGREEPSPSPLMQESPQLPL